MQYIIILSTVALAIAWTWVTWNRWNDKYKTAFFSGIFTVGQYAILVFLAYRSIFMGMEAREGAIFLASFANMVSGFFLIGYPEGKWRCLSTVGFVILFCLFGWVFGSQMGEQSVSYYKKSEVKINSRSKVEQILGLRNLPPYQYDKAWEEDFSTMVHFKYTQPQDSVAYMLLLDSIKQAYPDFCGVYYDRSSLERFSTVWDKNEMYANVYFDKDGFTLGYGVTDHEDELSKRMRDSLGCEFPENNIAGYYWRSCGPDYLWNAIYKLDHSLKPKDFRSLRSACEKKKGWEYKEKGDTITLMQREQGTKGNTCSFEFAKDPKGRYSKVKVEYVDY